MSDFCTANDIIVGDIITVVADNNVNWTGPVVSIAEGSRKRAFLVEQGAWSSWYGIEGTLLRHRAAIRACGVFRKDDN